MRNPEDLPKIRTTNALAAILRSEVAADILRRDLDAIDDVIKIHVSVDEDKEEKEKKIPEIIHEVLGKESGPFSHLIKRCFFEEDAWLVQVGCGEGEHLIDDGHEIFSSAHGKLIPAMIEEYGVSMHFVKIHTPRVFVQTLILPMTSRTEHKS